MPYLTKRVGFSAAHFYWNPEFSEDQNREIFRACANREGHGHNYRVEVMLEGEPDPQTGMIVNFYDLEPVLQRAILDPLDHKNLNTQVPFFNDKIPTLENIALFLWEGLSHEIQTIGLTLHRIKVVENDDLYIEYDGALA